VRKGKPNMKKTRDIPEDFFGPVIYTYTSHQAFEDGILFELGKVRGFEDCPINIATTNLLNKGYLVKDVLNVPNLIDLVAQCLNAMGKQKSDTFYSVMVEFPDGSKSKVFIQKNDTEKFTVMCPEDY
jgi:hypothetical protein